MEELNKLGYFISNLGDSEYIEFYKGDEDYEYLLSTLQNYYEKMKQDIMEV